MRFQKRVYLLLLCTAALIAGCATPGATETKAASPTSIQRSSPTATLAPTSTRTPIPTPTLAPTLDPCNDSDPYNGWMYHEYCIPGVISEDFWLSPNPNHFVGMATYYGDGLMEKVAARRGMDLNGVWGGVALMNCGDIGKEVYLKRSPQYEFEGPYRVVDCSHKRHLFYNVVINGLAVEVDWQTAQRWGMTGGLLGVHVCKTYPDCGPAVTLSAWFEKFVTWEIPQ